jgi:predicted transcriptional regulator YdeE
MKFALAIKRAARVTRYDGVLTRTTKEPAMTHVEQPQDLTIIGLSVRTSPEQAAEDLPALWQRFLARAAELPRGADPATYAVYCDYQADHAAPYTAVLGFSVDAATPVPAGLRRVRVPAGLYARFVSRGAVGRAVWESWQHINSVWPGREHRRYVADLERYPTPPSADGQLEAEVLVGLSPATRTRTSVRSSEAGVTSGSSR